MHELDYHLTDEEAKEIDEVCVQILEIQQYSSVLSPICLYLIFSPIYILSFS